MPLITLHPVDFPLTVCTRDICMCTTMITESQNLGAASGEWQILIISRSPLSRLRVGESSVRLFVVVFFSSAVICRSMCKLVLRTQDVLAEWALLAFVAYVYYCFQHTGTRWSFVNIIEEDPSTWVRKAKKAGSASDADNAVPATGYKWGCSSVHRLHSFTFLLEF